jgi:hypothetical protein
MKFNALDKNHYSFISFLGWKLASESEKSLSFDQKP